MGIKCDWNTATPIHLPIAPLMVKLSSCNIMDGKA